LFLDLVARRREGLLLVARGLLGALAQELPVEVVLRLGERHAFAGDDLGRLGRSRLLRHLHRRHE
jgi:hypothetical protein